VERALDAGAADKALEAGLVRNVGFSRVPGWRLLAGEFLRYGVKTRITAGFLTVIRLVLNF
jgi:hypothetical protein